MEIKIAVKSVHHELIVETDMTMEQVEDALRNALAVERGVFAITDTGGRRIVVPVASLGYIEMGKEEPRMAGFAGML
ncbi:DUF3107 domain-containing protein [Rhizohabitans arisaemae]|uniref:DUF3107 domain-containing protein n=1 Tax=Rhizohabitans arisaemae TaxID=2720610 RepID=UPI0024B23FA6|nr:DUF3107 domain-containing protein [Rhizohabitans arisaemae]